MGAIFGLVLGVVIGGVLVGLYTKKIVINVEKQP